LTWPFAIYLIAAIAFEVMTLWYFINVMLLMMMIIIIILSQFIILGNN